jgi:outer membrane protein assembly factor BamB
MQRFRLLAALLGLTTALTLLAEEPRKAPDADPITVAPADWPWWRGPTRDGHAAAGQKPPLKWSETENVLWKVPVPGRGHGSPIVVGDQVILATAEDARGTQSVLCFDRLTGKQAWQNDVHKNVVHQPGGNAKASMASATAACDGKRIFINFLSGPAVYTTALDRDGKQLWQTKVADYTLHQGFASSPTVFESLVLVTADNKGGTGVVAGLDRATGKIVWSQDRPKYPNYASPIVLKVGGREQTLVSGCKLVASFDPRTGKKLWEIPGSTEETVTSTGTDGQHIFTSGGYPRSHVAAILADGSGKVVWENNTKVYVPSMLVHDGYLYAVKDGGGAVCWKADTGKEAWSSRLDGNFTASPVLVGEHIYASNESGRTYIFKVSPQRFDLVGENQLGDEALATPAICGSRIYLRVATRTPTGRQEWLYCVGNPG